MKKLYLFLPFAFFCNHICCAQYFNTDKIDQYLSEVYQNHIMPGFSVVVVNKEKILFLSSYGFVQVGSNNRFTDQTVVPVGSLTKSITALAVLQLVEQGKISLNDPIKKYLPEFTTANPDKSNRITVRMLLNNTSGLGGKVRNSFDMSEASIEKMLQNLSNSFLTKEPGTVYQYSNIGFSIAGLLISKVSGQTYSEYVTERIFKPLNMSKTSVLPLVTKDLACGHFPGIDKAIPSNDPGILSGEFVAAGRFTQSNAPDLGAYLMMYLNQGAFSGRRLISAPLIKEQWEPEIDFVGLSENEGGDGKKFHYGLGWMIAQIDGRKVVHHGGSTGTASSFTMIDTEKELAVSLLTNVDLTLIDRRKYIFGLAIVNNILHLAGGNPVTNFAKPTKTSSNTNSFTMPREGQAKYLGEYQYRQGGDNLVYFDQPNMVISQKDSLLVGTIYRNSQVINQFVIDFVNPAFAVTRNIASPNYLRFQLAKSGKITAVYGFGMKLVRSEEVRQLSLKSDLYGPLQYKYSSNWKRSFSETGFVLTNPAFPSMRIDCQFLDKPLNMKFIGSQDIEQINQITWLRRSAFSHQGGLNRLMTIFTTPLNDRYFMVSLISPASEHSYHLIKEVKPFLERIEIMENN